MPREHLLHARDLDHIDADGVLHGAMVCAALARAKCGNACLSIDFRRHDWRGGDASMTASIIDGNAIARQIRDEVQADIERLRTRGVDPGLVVVLVGENPASVSYVRGKTRDAEEIGIRSETLRLP